MKNKLKSAVERGRRWVPRMVRPITKESNDPELTRCLQVIGEALKRQSDSMRGLVLALEDGFSRPVAASVEHKASESGLENPDQTSQSRP